MKIAIVGTGAMGSVYAGLFASAGHEVWAIDAWREHVEAMRKNGLRLEGKSGDRTVKVHASTDPAEAGPCDLVVLATKAMHVRDAASSIKGSSVLGSDTPVLSIQNGLGGPDAAAEILGRERVMVGVNKYTNGDETGNANIPLLRIDEEVQKRQVVNLHAVKARREGERVKACLDGVRQAAKEKSNLMPPIIEAAKAYCTQQEICDVLREVFGTYTDPAEF